MQVIDAWEPVTETDVQTPLEAYAELIEDGYDVVSTVGRLWYERYMCACCLQFVNCRRTVR